MMPALDGYAVLERMKAHEAWRHTPVVMISALMEIGSIVRCIELGAFDYLPKPFEPVILEARIRGSAPMTARSHTCERSSVSASGPTNCSMPSCRSRPCRN